MNDQDGIGWGETFSPILFTKNAFEMLKTSGTMRYITDRELLEKIWRTYWGLENEQNFLDECYKWKKDLRIIELTTNEDTPVPNRIFYSLGMSIAMETRCKETAEYIREMLSEWQ